MNNNERMQAIGKLTELLQRGNEVSRILDKAGFPSFKYSINNGVEVLIPNDMFDDIQDATHADASAVNRLDNSKRLEMQWGKVKLVSIYKSENPHETLHEECSKCIYYDRYRLDCTGKTRDPFNRADTPCAWFKNINK